MEIEVRILDIDVESIRKKIIDNKGVLVKKENQVNKLFDFDDKRLLNEKGYARIRVIEDLILNKQVSYMCVKKAISSHTDKYKVMDEKETIINDPKVGEDIFNSLGLKLNHEIKKYRESYRLLNVLVEIDINDKSFYPDPYIEIEGENEEDIENVVKLLGYTLEDTTSMNIFELINMKYNN